MSDKLRCSTCTTKMGKTARYCTKCGSPRGSLSKSFYQEANPVMREGLWKAQHAPALVKAAAVAGR